MTGCAADSASTVSAMDENLPSIRRLCLAYDIDLLGEDGVTGRALAVRRGNLTFAQVCASLGLGRILLARRGAGRIGLFPVGIDEPEVISSLVMGLFQALTGLDIRFRIAFHE